MRALAALASVSLVGCFWVTTREQGRQLDERITRLEKQLESDRQEYTELIGKAEKDLAELEGLIERATRATADYVADSEGMRAELAGLAGQLEELRADVTKNLSTFEQRQEGLRDRVEAIATKVGLDPPLDPTRIPQDKQAHLAAADDAVQKGQYGQARSLYRAYIERYANDPLVDNVQLKVGQAYAAEGRHAQALSTFNIVVDRYPDSDVMGETLLAMADSLYKMRACNDSITLLQAVIQRYSKGDLAKTARERLRDVQQAKRRGCQ